MAKTTTKNESVKCGACGHTCSKDPTGLCRSCGLPVGAAGAVEAVAEPEPSKKVGKKK